MTIIDKLEEQKIKKCPNCGANIFFCEDFNATIVIIEVDEKEEYSMLGSPQPLPRVRISCNMCDLVIYEGI